MNDKHGAGRVQVRLMFRTPGLGKSHERLYETVQANLPAMFKVEEWFAPGNSMRPLGFVRNLFEARRSMSDINHITGGVLTYLLFALPRDSTVVTIHDCATLRRLSGWRHWVWLHFWYRWPLRRAEVIVAVSEATRRELEEWVPEVSQKLRVINNCIPEEFSPAPNEFEEEVPTILQVGTSSRKNLRRVAQALEGITCKLRIIGELSAEQRDQLERSGVDYSSVHDVPDDKMVQEYERADMLVFASTLEGFGMPIVEAQTVGRPVVTSRWEPMSSVSGGAAMLVDPESTMSIRNGILKIINDRHFRERCVEDGYENARQFRPETVADKYAKVYNEIIEGHS